LLHTIGGTAPGAGNVISGNDDDGISISSQGQLTLVEGNRIGTDADGTAALPNTRNGVSIFLGLSNTIGGTAAGAGNVISGNAGYGIYIRDAGVNTVVGNLIGTDGSGQSAIGNGIGIELVSAADNVIGGTTAASANVISGNTTAAIEILESASNGNIIAGNLLGLYKVGQAAVLEPNSTTGAPIGILLQDAPDNTIGGTATGAANVFAGFAIGIMIAGVYATGDAIVGDQIGTGLAGEVLPSSIGVGVYLDGVTSDTVGGTTAGAGDVIVGYSNYGVYIYGQQATENTVQGNRIGAGGPSPSMQLAGIAIQDSSGNTLGGTTPSAGNIIAGNAYAGIYIFGHGDSASDNLIAHDRFQGNAYGILLFNAAKNGGYATLLRRNRFARNGIADVREFTGAAAGGSASRPASARAHKRPHHIAADPLQPGRLRTRQTTRISGAVPAERSAREAVVEDRGPLHDPPSVIGSAAASPRPAAVGPRGRLGQQSAAASDLDPLRHATTTRPRPTTTARRAITGPSTAQPRGKR
jgi:hypothetical protein